MFRRFLLNNDRHCHTWKIGLICGHALGLPPGIKDGPYLAPSSPPLTPLPTKRIPFCSRSLVRLVVSWYSELPPSMIISPEERRGTNCSIKASTAAPAISSDKLYFYNDIFCTVFNCDKEGRVYTFNQQHHSPWALQCADHLF